MGLVLLVILAGIYFVPTIVGRDKRNVGAIFALNFFLGWTLVGWVVALVWALTQESPTTVALSDATTGAAQGPALLCSNCGKYSAPTSKFCVTCGTPVLALPA
jgi:hypothetical protein